MTAEFAFATWREAAQRLNSAARQDGVELHALPYRRFDPEADATWWLAPSSSNPAFADGKVVLEGPSPQSPDGPLIGLHIEKGVGPAATEVFGTSARGRRLLIDDGWIWRSFFREMAAGTVDRQLDTAVKAAGGLPLTVAIVTAVQGLPSLAGEEDRPVGIDVEYVWYRAADRRLDRVDEHNPGDVARRLAAHESFVSLAGKIGAVPDLDWRWIEVMIGIPFRRVANGGLSPLQVWRQTCAPWQSWLR